MIRRSAWRGDTECSALYSDCENYRFDLTRIWDRDGPRLFYVMLNPSTATETQDDPTIARCEKRARLLGFGAMKIGNIFALRETHPELLRADPNPEGPENKAVLQDGAAWADVILCAWGVHGEHMGQGARVAQSLISYAAKLHVLGLTKDGHPRHPLYISYATKPRPWPLTNSLNR